MVRIVCLAVGDREEDSPLIDTLQIIRDIAIVLLQGGYL